MGAYYIIIRGPLGAGKSTVAKRLASNLGLWYFSIDKLLSEYDLEKEREDGYISQRSFLKANEVAVERAKKLLDRGTSVVFDGNFYWKSQLDGLTNMLLYPHYVFTLHAALEVCWERDRKRSRSLGFDAAEAVYNKVMSFNYGTEIDANVPVEKVVDEIIAKLPKPSQ